MPDNQAMGPYNPTEIESKWYRFWEQNNLFHAESTNKSKPFSIVIPPPNVTGSLHMGHALNNTLQDALIRYKKMQGFNAMWMPGTDHAGIATQYVVEKDLQSKNMNRHDMGREQFIERVWEWKHEHGGKIIHQLRKLGAACDWERERFTMDEGLSKAVREVFVSLYEEGLIYQGDYIINWCPRCHTALSDLEVEFHEEKGHLWHIKYPSAEGDGGVIVATTRPETMFGDTAVAVNPEDERYKDLIGKDVILPLKNKRIPVIADSYVDMEFGTGALKITPAHDLNDYEIGLRHNLAVVSVIDQNGIMTEEAGEAYKGMDIYECRQAAIRDLEEQDLLIEEEDYVHQVGHCYRCRKVVEPSLSKQWFVKVEPLAKPAIEAVKNGSTRFVPQQWEKTYYEWMNNIRDWCISRQLWWGHRIPVWTCSECGEVIVRREDPTSCPKCQNSKLIQDEDVLDTWFSSALWPFSTMGWPEKTDALEVFYPTTVLVTAFDIIFFWVARMMMMGLKFMKNVPFEDVYIHALVLDAEGKKMSKSRGNVIDPLEIIDEFGADAFRFTLTALAAQGRNIRLSEQRIEGYRHFANKIWNAVRFALMQIPGGESGAPRPADFKPSLADRWIMSRMQKVASSVTAALDRYEFNEAAHQIYQFTWHELCDWYIEIIKPVLEGNNGEDAMAAARYVLIKMLQDILKLLHPFMPFITEELFQKLRGDNDPKGADSIMRAAFPAADDSLIDPEAEQQMDLLMKVISTIRNLRSEVKLDPKERADMAFCSQDAAQLSLLKDRTEDIKLLCRLNEISHYEESRTFPRSIGMVVPGGIEVHLLLKEIPDLSAEISRLQKALKKIEKELNQSVNKLKNEKFLSNAPEDVIEKERSKKEENEDSLTKLKDHIERISSLVGQ
jgi:valyl-tRNA synthetase